jgi:C-terminal processing protease CtpA/Prc
MRQIDKTLLLRLTAEEYAQLQEQNANSYVGIGITIQAREDKNGFTITKVEPGGSAQAGGIQPGDILIGAGRTVSASKIGTGSARLQHRLL